MIVKVFRYSTGRAAVRWPADPVRDAEDGFGFYAVAEADMRFLDRWRKLHPGKWHARPGQRQAMFDWPDLEPFLTEEAAGC